MWSQQVMIKGTQVCSSLGLNISSSDLCAHTTWRFHQNTDSDSVGLVWAPGVCLSGELPCDEAAVGARISLWVVKLRGLVRVSMGNQLSKSRLEPHQAGSSRTNGIGERKSWDCLATDQVWTVFCRHFGILGFFRREAK